MFDELFQLIKLLFQSSPSDIKELKIKEMKYFPFSNYNAMSWCGYLIVRKDSIVNKTTMCHETIHLKQAQQYSNWLAYYFDYFKEWLKGQPFATPCISAYYTIPFEVEAYANEDKPDYITSYDKTLIKKKYTFNNRKQLYQKYKTFDKWQIYIKTL